MSGEGWSSEYDFLRQSMLNTNQTMTSKFSACLKSMAGRKLSERRNILRLSRKSAMTLNATKRRREKRKREDARQGSLQIIVSESETSIVRAWSLNLTPDYREPEQTRFLD